YLDMLRPFIDSVDFHYYICYARDMVRYPADVPADAYRYFPGVYTFWRTAIRLTDGDVAELQTIYLGVLVGNALLVGSIIWRAGRSAAGSLYGGIWYLVLASRFEGFAAVTE